MTTERRQYFTALAPVMLEGGEEARQQMILPPGATAIRFHLLDGNKFEAHTMAVLRPCLGALVFAEVTIRMKATGAERVLGGVSFDASAEEIATSPKEFRQLKHQRGET